MSWRQWRRDANSLCLVALAVLQQLASSESTVKIDPSSPPLKVESVPPIPAPPPKPPLTITSCRPLCNGCPSDHTTVALTLANDSEKTIRVAYAEFNLKELKFSRFPVHYRERTCRDATKSENWLSVDIVNARSGCPIRFPASVTIPPHEERPLIITFHFRDIPAEWLANYSAVGTLTIAPDSYDVALKDLCLAGEWH